MPTATRTRRTGLSRHRLVDAAGEALAEIAPAVEAQPRVNGSIFRINRDVRFSKDKRPYKGVTDDT
jgi:uncharacterized protein (DUF2461 family)